METDLFSFKILVHRVLIERNIFRPSYTAIERPSFSVRVFNYPTFLVYGPNKITAEEVQRNEYIKIGNGKSTSFECLASDLKKLVSEIPLMVSFVDAGSGCLTVIAKSLIGVQLFAKDLEHFFENGQENWRRNAFDMFDEGQNLIGKIDLSISFVKRKRDNFNPRAAMTSTGTAFRGPEVNKGTLMSPMMPTQKLEKKEEIIPTDSHYNWDMNNTKKIKFQDEVQPPVSEAPQQTTQSFKKRATSAKPGPPKVNAIPNPTLKTIVESHYCPPVMYFQKKTEKVTSSTTDNFGHKENYDHNYKSAQVSAGAYSSGGSFGKKKPKPILTNSRYNDDVDRSFESDKRPQTAQPVVILTTKESNELAKRLGLTLHNNTGSGGTNYNSKTDSLLDALITELVTLKNRQRSNKPSPRADSFEDSQGNRSPVKRSSISKERDSTAKMLESGLKSQGEYNSPQFPPRINNLVGSNQVQKSGLVNPNPATNPFNKPPKKETPTNNQREENSIQEDYSNDFESLSVSQNISGVRTSKEILQSTNKQKISASNISESYPDDFEASANLSARPEKKAVTFKESQSISEDISMSTSLNKNFDRLVEHFKKTERLDSRISEYSEDFEALSEDG